MKINNPQQLNIAADDKQQVKCAARDLLQVDGSICQDAAGS